MTVTQAAEHLGVHPSRVRALVSAGALAGRRVGSQWLVQRDALERRAQIVGSGGHSRAMSTRIAWAAADLLDGGSADWLSTSERARLRARLAAHAGDGWQTYSRWLSSRQTRVARYRIADDDIAVLLATDGVVATGASAASAYRLGLSAAGQAEVYAAGETVAQLVDELFLLTSATGNLLMRTVDGDWHRRTATTRRGRVVAARLMTAVDLVDGQDARSRRVGTTLLGQVLADQLSAAGTESDGGRGVG